MNDDDFSSTAPTCQCPECKCTAMLDEDAWELPRRERLCEDCAAGEHFEKMR